MVILILQFWVRESPEVARAQRSNIIRALDPPDPFTRFAMTKAVEPAKVIETPAGSITSRQISPGPCRTNDALFDRIAGTSNSRERPVLAQRASTVRLRANRSGSGPKEAASIARPAAVVLDIEELTELAQL